MKVPEISAVNTNTKIYAYEDFSMQTSKSNGVLISKLKLRSAPSLIKTGVCLKKGVRPVKIYNDGKDIYVYCTDGKVYKKGAKGYVPYKIANITRPPEILSIYKDGKPSTMITTESGAYVINDTFAYVGVKNADCYAIYNGILFLGVGRKIYVCGQTDYTGYNVNYDTDNFLRIEQSLGSVKKLVPTNNGLLVFCLRGIAVINTAIDEIGYAIDRPLSTPVKPIPETIKKVGEKVYFISVDGFLSFDGEALKKHDCLLDKTTYSVLGEATCFGEYYLLPINVDGEKYFYLYNVLSGEEGFILSEQNLLTDEGYAINLNGEESVLSIDDGALLWESEKNDYGTQKIKTLCGIYLKSEKPVTVSVYSEQAVKRFTLPSGTATAMLSIRSKYFKIKLACDGKNTITALKVKYKY